MRKSGKPDLRWTQRKNHEAQFNCQSASVAMKARIVVTLKSGVLDPQGKVFDIEIEGSDRKQAQAALKAAADKLLANTLIENYDVKLLG